MFLDYAEPLLQLPYTNDLSIAIFILKLFCNKFNLFNESYEDEQHIDRIKFRYYLQITFNEEINNEIEEYKTNFTNEIKYYGKMFNLTNNFKEYKYDLLEGTSYTTEIQIPTYENRILISKKFLENMNLENIRELNKNFLNLWITNFEEKIDINNLIDKRFIKQKKYLIMIYQIVLHEINKKYYLGKYEQLKLQILNRLFKFKTKDDFYKLMNSIMDIKKLKLDICHKNEKQVAVP